MTHAQVSAIAPVQPTPTSAPSTRGAVIDQTYILGPGDRIQISFLNVPEYNNEQQILVDGTLSLPIVGRISISGLTLEQAEARLSSLFQQELRNPSITIGLVNPRPLSITVSGEVQTPGFYTLSLAENGSFPSVVQAIQLAGGTTLSANLRQVQIQRQQPSGLQIIPVDLWMLVETGDASQNLTLRDGDSIVVPTAESINLAETSRLTTSNLAANQAQSFDVAVIGQVVRPGSYRLGGETGTGQPSLSQAIQLAGGIRPDANIRQVEVRRPTRSGSLQTLNIDFWQLIQSGDLTQDIALQEGDTIFIPTADTLTPEELIQLGSANISPAAIQINIIGEVRSPGPLQVPTNTTLNQALLTVGGLQGDARRSVKLLRLNPDGTLTQQIVRVDLSEGIDPETNPVLWNNDVIVVGRSTLNQIIDQVTGIFRLLSPFQSLF